MPKQFQKDLKHFFHEREWDQFHSPKNLVMDLGSEVGELLDEFRWLTEEESFRPGKIDAIRDEIGDVFIALCALSEKLGIDPLEAAQNKLVKLATKYPVHLSKGNRLKHSDLNK